MSSPGMAPVLDAYWKKKMTSVKDVVTVVPALVLSAVAVLGIAVLIGLSAWDLPINNE